MDPAWAFGVAFIIVAFSLRHALPRLLTSVAEKNEAERALQQTASAEEVEELRHRLAEVEERLDFAERMLAQQQEPDKLPKGESPR
jgi:Tfp pilus assembly protein PilO